MGELGELLKEARQQKGLSLEQVEEATRIRRKYLQALEEENFGVLPAEVYVKGFLRNYAQYLDLDVEEVMALYAEKAARGEGASPSPDIFRPMSIPVSRPSWLTPDLVIGALLIVALLGFGAWAAWRYLPPLRQYLPLLLRTPTPPEPTATPMPSPSPTLSAALPLPTPTPPPTATPTPPPSPTPTLTPTPRAPAGVEVELRIVERAWLRVVVDGEVAFEGALEAGSRRTWRGRESVALRCGNAGGVRVTVNGEDLGLLGERGQVVEEEWLAEGVTPTPATPEVTATPTIGATATP